MPKVSALMPVYNSNLAYLKETIESVLNQTFSDFDFLILNDSPQNLELENFILEYAKKDERIKYFKNPRNLGISGSRNKLIDLAKGEFLAVIDHDDISVKERFEKEVAFLEANEEVGVVGGNLKTLLDNTITKCPNNSNEIKIRLTAECVVFHPATMIRKSVLKECRYNAFYSPCEDYKLWCDLLDKTEFANLDEVMIEYRDFENTSSKNEKLMQMITRLIVQENKQKYPLLYNANCDTKNDNKETTISLFGIPVLKILTTDKITRVRLFKKLQILKITKG